MLRLLLLPIALLTTAAAATDSKADPKAEPKSRTFRFTYEVTVSGLKPGESARVWLPVPSTSADQTIEIAQQQADPSAKIDTEPKYGNRILYQESKAGADGTIAVKMVYLLTRKEVRAEAGGMLMRDEIEKFLKPDAKVPASGKYLKLIEGKELPKDQLALGRALYDIVDGELRYSKEGTGWGNGDVEWVCDSKYGNCSDFHSLFIGLVRSRNVPGKFEIGFPLPEARGKGEIAGYHCWAKFRPAGMGWVPVDISEANKNPKLKDYYFGNLSEDRVTFSVGRDLTLVPKQDGELLNFFVYPYVEVGGKPYAADKVKKRFSYEDR
jgi:transglutaminase-like putative cysteine protease